MPLEIRCLSNDGVKHETPAYFFNVVGHPISLSKSESGYVRNFFCLLDEIY